MIHVCSLARLNDTVKTTGARHVVTLSGIRTMYRRRGVAENHLRLQMHDITEPAEGQ